jgi:hypothetical protein
VAGWPGCGAVAGWPGCGAVAGWPGCGASCCAPVPLVTFARKIGFSRSVVAMVVAQTLLKSRILREDFRIVEFVYEKWCMLGCRGGRGAWGRAGGADVAAGLRQLRAVAL